MAIETCMPVNVMGLTTGTSMLAPFSEILFISQPKLPLGIKTYPQISFSSLQVHASGSCQAS
jgi:hypothetical protein